MKLATLGVLALAAAALVDTCVEARNETRRKKFARCACLGSCGVTPQMNELQLNWKPYSTYWLHA